MLYVLADIEAKEIILIAVIPFEEQAKYWDEPNRDIYYNILAQCDDVITLHTRYRQGCYNQTNRYMADHSSKIICYYDDSKGDTVYTVKYAKQNNVKITNLFEN